MKKKDLKKEINRLIDENINIKNDLDIMMSDGIEFDKMMVRSKYDFIDQVHEILWVGKRNGMTDILTPSELGSACTKYIPREDYSSGGCKTCGVNYLHHLKP